MISLLSPRLVPREVLFQPANTYVLDAIVEAAVTAREVDPLADGLDASEVTKLRSLFLSGATVRQVVMNEVTVTQLIIDPNDKAEMVIIADGRLDFDGMVIDGTDEESAEVTELPVDLPCDEFYNDNDVILRRLRAHDILEQLDPLPPDVYEAIRLYEPQVAREI